MMQKYKNKYKAYPNRYEVPKPAKHIDGTNRVHISSLKNYDDRWSKLFLW